MHLLNPKICTFEIKNEVFRQTDVSGKAMTTQPDRQIGFFLTFRILVVA